MSLMHRSFLQTLLRHLRVGKASSNVVGSDAILRLLQQMMSLDTSAVLHSADAQTGLVDFFVGVLSLRFVTCVLVCPCCGVHAADF